MVGKGAKPTGGGGGEMKLRLRLLGAIYPSGVKHPCHRDIIDIYWGFAGFYPCQHPCQSVPGAVTSGAESENRSTRDPKEVRKPKSEIDFTGGHGENGGWRNWSESDRNRYGFQIA